MLTYERWKELTRRLSKSLKTIKESKVAKKTMTQQEAFAWAGGVWSAVYVAHGGGVCKVGYRDVQNRQIIVMGEGCNWHDAVERAKLNIRDSLHVRVINED